MSWNNQSQISEISRLLICSQDRVAKLPSCAGVYTLSGVAQTLRYCVSRAEWCLSDLEKEEDVARSLLVVRKLMTVGTVVNANVLPTKSPLASYLTLWPPSCKHRTRQARVATM